MANRFLYLYFRLLEYIPSQPRPFATSAEIKSWIEDQTLLSFLAHFAMTATRSDVTWVTVERRHGERRCVGVSVAELKNAV